MHTFDDMIKMTPEEFSKSWKDNTIQDSCLKLLGNREMTEDEKKQLEI